ncbi:glycerol kinase 5 [Trichonephila clavata]|uniref:Glycerol kinase 5 n=1 Tax=Trichonephila clavata TaxID=2740835 RepID=A0A8X6J510_TRICU|nr:glycerol kinase 5 [Trichonephila clavata]
MSHSVGEVGRLTVINYLNFHQKVLPKCVVEIGDQQASIFGAGCFKNKEMSCTMGTGTFLHVNTGCEPASSCSGIYPLNWMDYSLNTSYILECGMHDVVLFCMWLKI